MKEHTERFRKSDILILVTGLVGAGRSTFINDILGKPRMKVGNPGSMLTCTTSIDYAIVDVCNKDYRLIIVDTPGFDDTHKRDAEVLDEISAWLHKYFPKGIVRGGVIYLHDISKDRYHAIANADLAILDRSFRGLGKVYRRVTIATTKWTRIDDKKGTSRQGELESRWQQLISGGSKVHRFKESADAWKIVNDLISTLETETELNIEELVELRKSCQGHTNTERIDMSKALNRLVRILFSVARR